MPHEFVRCFAGFESSGVAGGGKSKVLRKFSGSGCEISGKSAAKFAQLGLPVVHTQAIVAG